MFARLYRRRYSFFLLMSECGYIVYNVEPVQKRIYHSVVSCLYGDDALCDHAGTWIQRIDHRHGTVPSPVPQAYGQTKREIRTLHQDRLLHIRQQLCIFRFIEAAAGPDITLR